MVRNGLPADLVELKAARSGYSPTVKSELAGVVLGGYRNLTEGRSSVVGDPDGSTTCAGVLVTDTGSVLIPRGLAERPAGRQ